MSNPVVDEWIIDLPDWGSIWLKSTYYSADNHTLIDCRYGHIDRAANYVARKLGRFTRKEAEVEWRVDKMTDVEAKARWEQSRLLCSEPRSLIDVAMPDATPVETFYEYQCLTRRLFPAKDEM
jgi:hypothetical protein